MSYLEQRINTVDPSVQIIQPKKGLTLILITMDLFIVGASWYLAHSIRFFYRDVLFPMPVPEFFPQYFQVIWVPVFLTLASFHYFEVYQGHRKSFLLELFQIFQALLFSVIFLLAFFYLFRKHQYSRLITLLFFLFTFFATGGSRLLVRAFLYFFYRPSKHAKRGLIVGAGLLGRNFAQKIADSPWLGIVVLGFLDDHEKGEDVLGNLSELKEFLDRENPEYLYITLPFGEYNKIELIQDSLAESMVSVRLIPDFYTLPTLRCSISDFIGFPMVHITDSPLDDSLNRFVKRAFDIVFSMATMFFLSPFFFLIAFLVKVSSSGSLFYRQERMGLDGRVFEIIKFRTMDMSAESLSGPVWASEKDERVRGIGAFLRRTSLDELPQFINVLKGDMSVVGPRPERPVFIEKFKKEVPKYMLRHKMKAGITGWAQINGWRGNTCLQKRIEHDLYYIEKWSFSLDLKIILLTIVKGFIHKNAY